MGNIGIKLRNNSQENKLISQKRLNLIDLILFPFATTFPKRENLERNLCIFFEQTIHAEDRSLEPRDMSRGKPDIWRSRDSNGFSRILWGSDKSFQRDEWRWSSSRNRITELANDAATTTTWRRSGKLYTDIADANFIVSLRGLGGWVHGLNVV